MPPMQKVKALKQGGTLGIIAPAASVNAESLLKGSNELQALGFQVICSESALSQCYYFAGSHDERAAELVRMFEDPRIDAIFCARGGYGCHHLLSRLDASRIKVNPKIFVGYSDVTVLLQFLE